MPQRHYITILFADLTDFTVLGEAWDPELVAELKGDLERIAQETVTRHGGIVNQTYGDGVLALFGYPDAREDDARRAALAALELHERVRSLRVSEPLPFGFSLAMHSGIHSGIAHVADGGAHQGRYTVTGDVVNTAARLSSSADRDVVLASEDSLGGASSFFETGQPITLELKGKQLPLRALPVLGRSDVATRFEARARHGLSPFVGRKWEIDRLEAALRGALARRLQVAVLVGHAGVGKSRVMRQFEQAHAGSAHVLRGSCEAFGDVSPFHPFVLVLRQVFGVGAGTTAQDAVRAIRARIAEVAPRLEEYLPMYMRALGLPHIESSRSRPEDVHAAIVAGTVELIVSLSEAAPVVLSLDDWQWADDASELLLRRLIVSASHRPILVIVASRERQPHIAGDADLTHVLVEPFRAAESRRLVQGLLPEAVGLGFEDGIHTHCGGNALFIEEVCRTVASAASRPGTFDATRVPATVREVLQARLQRLDEDALQALRLAAVAGQEFTASQLTDEPGESLRLRLEELVESDWVRRATEGEEDAYCFKHGIAREVAYDSILLRERRHMHEQAARRIETRHSSDLAPHFEALAHHYAGSLDHERAAHYAVQAAMKAAATNALGSAQKQYRAALSSLDQVEPTPKRLSRWLQVARAWAATCVFSPDRRQLELLELARERAVAVGSDDDLAHIHYWLGWIYYALGEQARAIEHDEKALEIAGALENTRLIAQLEVNLGQSHAAACEYPQAREHLQRGLEVKSSTMGAETAKGRSVPVGFAYAVGYRALVHGDLGEFKEAYANLQLALTAVANTGHAIEGSLWTQLGMVQLWQGRWPEALETAAHMRSTAERVNGPYIYTMSQVIRGYALAMQGEGEPAVEQLRQAADWLDTTQMRLNLSWALALAADALARGGERESAQRYAERALQRGQTKDRLGEIMARRALARVSASELDESKNQLFLALARARDIGSRREMAITELHIAELLAQHSLVGHAQRAAATVGEFVAMEMPWFEALARRLAS